jgi:cytoskeletal protein CcmA (bactofilin family)
MFGRETSVKTEPNNENEPAVRIETPTTSAAVSHRSFIGQEITLDAKVTGEGDLVIGGTVRGEIGLAGHQVTIEETGEVEADIQADSVVVHGSFKGKLVARGLVRLKNTARFEGDLKAARLQMEDGAKLKGNIELL